MGKASAPVALGAMISAYTAFFLYYSLAKHYSFMTYMLDLGVYDHAFWVLMNGGLPLHRSGAMYLLLPLYFLNPRAETLLVLQAPVIPLASVPLYKLTEYVSGSRTIALMVAALYLLYPPIHGISAYDFHLEAFLPLLFLTLAYSFERGRWKLYLASLALLLSTMETATFLAVSFSAYLLVHNIKRSPSRRWAIRLKADARTKLAIVTLAASLSLLAITAPPPGLHQPLQGPSLAQRAEYLVKLYGPLAFIPMLSPSHLIAAAPWLAYVMLGNVSQEYLGIYNQYPAYVAPFIFMGFVNAIGKLRALEGKFVHLDRRGILLAFLSCSLFLASVDPVLAAPYPAHTPIWPVPTERDRVLLQIIQQVPRDASVLTQNNIAPHLSNRKEIYISLQSLDVLPQFILVDTNHFSYSDGTYGPSPAQLIPLLMQKAPYGIMASCDGIVLYALGYRGPTLGCSSFQGT
jgi:uncharacterized membrane protein